VSGSRRTGWPRRCGAVSALSPLAVRQGAGAPLSRSRDVRPHRLRVLRLAPHGGRRGFHEETRPDPRDPSGRSGPVHGSRDPRRGERLGVLPNNAEEFFDALYGALEQDSGIVTRTASEAADPAAARPLPRVVAGSWIGRHLATWIDTEKNRAWERIAETRRAVAERRGAPRFEDPAWRAVFAAEGSDWEWWFGDDHPTPFAAEFDASFRRTSGPRGPRWASSLPSPSAGRFGIGLARIPAPDRTDRPAVDGRVTDYFEWLPAGRADAGTGTMQAATRLVREVHYGSDGERLFVRLDPCDPPRKGPSRRNPLAAAPGYPERTRRVPMPPSGLERSEAGEVAVGKVVEASFPAELRGGGVGIHFQVEIETWGEKRRGFRRTGACSTPTPRRPSRWDWSCEGTMRS